MPDLAAALELVLPAAQYTGSLTDNTQDAYNSIIWDDPRPKPSYAAVLAADDTVTKTALKVYSARVRYIRQKGGFTYQGSKFTTDPGSITALTSAYSLAKANSSYSTQWKLASGDFISMNANTIIGAYTAISAFIETLFKAEATLSVAIDGGTVTSNTQIVAQINNVPNGS